MNIGLDQSSLEEQNLNLRLQVAKLQVALQGTTLAQAVEGEEETGRLRQMIATLQQALSEAQEGQRMLEAELKESRALACDLEEEKKALRQQLQDLEKAASASASRGVLGVAGIGQHNLKGDGCTDTGSAREFQQSDAESTDRLASVQRGDAPPEKHFSADVDEDVLDVTAASQFQVQRCSPDVQARDADNGEADEEASPMLLDFVRARIGLMEALTTAAPSEPRETSPAPPTSASHESGDLVWAPVRVPTSTSPLPPRHDQTSEAPDHQETDSRAMPDPGHLRHEGAAVGSAAEEACAVVQEGLSMGVSPKDPEEPSAEWKQRSLPLAFCDRLESAILAGEDGAQLGVSAEDVDMKVHPTHVHSAGAGAAAKGHARRTPRARKSKSRKRRQRKQKQPGLRRPVSFEERLQKAEAEAAGVPEPGAVVDGQVDPQHWDASAYPRETSEERRSREYLEVLTILEAGLAHAPAKYRQALVPAKHQHEHHPGEPRLHEERHGRSPSLSPLRPSPHEGATLPPPHLGPQARRVDSPVVRQGPRQWPSPPAGILSASPTSTCLRSGERRVLSHRVLPGGTFDRPLGSSGGLSARLHSGRPPTPTSEIMAHSDPGHRGVPAHQEAEDSQILRLLEPIAAIVKESGNSRAARERSPEGASPARAAWDQTFSEETVVDAAAGRGGAQQEGGSPEVSSARPGQAADESRLDFLAGEILKLEKQLLEAQRRLVSPPGMNGSEGDGDEESQAAARSRRQALKTQFRARQHDLEALKEEALLSAPGLAEDSGSMATLSSLLITSGSPLQDGCQRSALCVRDIANMPPRSDTQVLARGAHKSKREHSERDGKENKISSGGAGTGRKAGARRKSRNPQSAAATRMAMGLPAKPRLQELGISRPGTRHNGAEPRSSKTATNLPNDCPGLLKVVNGVSQRIAAAGGGHKLPTASGGTKAVQAHHHKLRIVT